ncbi:MAG: tetraacyldisaccharide 4'-kinase [Campylobacterota bacterium]|nr:tetraacyldisaccharide 4'-kinase [Campylobacterota bacterium]
MHAISIFVEDLFYKPNIYHKTLSFLLLPFSYIYCLIVYIKYNFSKEQNFNIPIISVGNLSVGGSGKTPLTIALASPFSQSAIILRGYGRQSQGLHVVSDGESILCDVHVSGDEAMIYAKKLPNSVVIVSEDRVKAIHKAKELGCKVVFLDDGYSKHFIKKLDILIDVKSENKNCLPAGPFRERLWSGKRVRVVADGVDFTKSTKLIDKTSRMALATAIAKPYRLKPFLPNIVGELIATDHYYFNKRELEEFMQNVNASSLLVTYKDLVKIEEFNLKTTLLDLEYSISDTLKNEVKFYIESFDFQ